MITVISGLPGHGKTLYALWLVEKMRQESSRPVYSCGFLPDGSHPQIKGLTLPWLHLEDPETWESLPAGSIVVIDECQFCFPNRGKSAGKPPEWIERLAVHRHFGLDFVLITQDAMNFDYFVRRLCGKHVHLSRKFGTEKCRVFEWEKVERPDDYHAKQRAVASWWTYPREVFDWYQSAEVHTVKRSLPKGKIVVFGALAAAMVLAVGGVLYVITSWGTEADSKIAAAGGVERGPVLPGAAVRVSAGGGVWSDQVRRERVRGLPMSAPLYDSQVKVQSAPRIEGCMMLEFSGGRVDCRCSSQQGTRLQVPFDVCRSFIENSGYFDFTRPDGEDKFRGNGRQEILRVPGSEGDV